MKWKHFKPDNIPPREVLQQILEVPPSRESGLDHHPCRVKLRSGEYIDRVVFVRQAHGLRGRDLNFDDIEEVSESPFRLPPRFADELYRAGESGMGYCCFQLVLRTPEERLVINCVTGSAMVDFPPLPMGSDSTQIEAVRPHAGRNERHWPEPPFLICYFWSE